MQDQPTPAIEFLRNFLGDAFWPLVAIRSGIIEAITLSNLPEREVEAVEWIERWNERERCDVYFGINKLKTALSRKAKKDDIAAAAWIWTDLDPKKNEEDAAAQARLDAAIAQLPRAFPGPRPGRSIAVAAAGCFGNCVPNSLLTAKTARRHRVLKGMAAV